MGEGKMGELYAGGPNLAKGYVGGAQPDKFIPNTHSEDPGELTSSYCCCSHVFCHLFVNIRGTLLYSYPVLSSDYSYSGQISLFPLCNCISFIGIILHLHHTL